MAHTCIVFDFDGVIVDSNEIKMQAWNVICQDQPKEVGEQLKIVLQRIREASRFDILRETALALRYENARADRFVAQMAESYQRTVKEAILTTYHADVKQALTRLRTGGARLYLNSATPQDPLEQTVDALGLREFFSGVYGSPPDKTRRLRELFAEQSVLAKEALVVGDGESDRASALAMSCRFIGIPNTFNGWSEATGIELVESVATLPGYLEAGSWKSV